MVDLSEADSYSIATFFMGGNSGRNEGCVGCWEGTGDINDRIVAFVGRGPGPPRAQSRPPRGFVFPVL